MKVRAKESCYVEKQFREAGEVFEWRNQRQEPLPACMESLEPVAPEAEPVPVEQPAQAMPRRPGRPRKQG